MFRLGRFLGLLSLTGVPLFVCCGGSSEGDGADSSDDSSSGSNGSSTGGPTIVDEVPEGGKPAGGADSDAPPPIVGGGSNSAPLGAGCGPETAGQCHPVGGDCNPDTLAPVEVVDADTTCFYEPEAEEPSAVAEYVTEVHNGQEYVHLRVTFHPSFVDNVYGECAARTGWGGDETEEAEPEPQPEPGKPKPMDGMMKPKRGKGGHTFKDLVGSDHVELMLSDCAGNLAMHFKLDYISEASTSCGYASAGVTGGEGETIVGSAEHILAASSSLDRNMNGCGYCELENSPCPGENYSSNSDAPEWDYRVVYEVWIDVAAFGSAGYCDVDIDAVHASPSKAEDNTVLVEPGDCPPPTCPPDYELYLTSEGEEVCVPTEGCPDGYVIDLTSEGESCIPVVK